MRRGPWDPVRAKTRNIRLACIGRISRVILEEFVDNYPEFLGMAVGGDAAAELARAPLDGLRSQLVVAWSDYTSEEEKSPRVALAARTCVGVRRCGTRPGVGPRELDPGGHSDGHCPAHQRPGRIPQGRR